MFSFSLKACLQWMPAFMKACRRVQPIIDDPTVEKYDRVRLLGKGSFGEVHLVMRRLDGEQFAVKSMPITNMDKEIESYQNEVRLLTELEHPGIVSHIESFRAVDNQHMCIVMGFADGGDLAAWLRKKQEELNGEPLPEDEVLFYFVQMAMSLDYMHDKSVLHRDLASKNIFIKNRLIQLGDFGLSKQLKGPFDCTQSSVGTPCYKSPEQFQSKPYNRKADVWSLVCVSIETMTYKYAFYSDNYAALERAVLNGEIAPLPSIYSESLRALVREMLDPEPNNRPSIKDILTRPFLRESIQKYVSAVYLNKHQYRRADLVNFHNQLRKIGMEGMIDEVALREFDVTACPDNSIDVADDNECQSELGQLSESK